MRSTVYDLRSVRHRLLGILEDASDKLLTFDELVEAIELTNIYVEALIRGQESETSSPPEVESPSEARVGQNPSNYRGAF